MFGDRGKKILFAIASVLIGIALTLVSSNAALAAKSDKLVLTYADNQHRDYPTVKAAYKFADLVKKRTDGRIIVKVYPNAELGDEKTTVELLRAGKIDLARASLSALTEYARGLEVLQLPYLYRNADHMWRVLEGDIGRELLDEATAEGIIGLSWYDAGVRNFYLRNKAIKKPEDMRGLLIRTQESALMMDMMETVGARPVSLIFSKVYGALAEGKIDGAENNLPSYESMKHYKVAKFYCCDEHSRIPEMQIISRATLEKLSEADREIIRECAAQSANYERELWAQREVSAAKKVTKGGAIIVRLTDEERQKFVEATQPFYEQYDEAQQQLIERRRAVK